MCLRFVVNWRLWPIRPGVSVGAAYILSLKQFLLLLLHCHLAALVALAPFPLIVLATLLKAILGSSFVFGSTCPLSSCLLAIPQFWRQSETSCHPLSRPWKAKKASLVNCSLSSVQVLQAPLLCCWHNWTTAMLGVRFTLSAKSDLMAASCIPCDQFTILQKDSCWNNTPYWNGQNH